MRKHEHKLLDMHGFKHAHNALQGEGVRSKIKTVKKPEHIYFEVYGFKYAHDARCRVKEWGAKEMTVKRQEHKLFDIQGYVHTMHAAGRRSRG